MRISGASARPERLGISGLAADCDDEDEKWARCIHVLWYSGYTRECELSCRISSPLSEAPTEFGVHVVCGGLRILAVGVCCLMIAAGRSHLDRRTGRPAICSRFRGSCPAGDGGGEFATGRLSLTHTGTDAQIFIERGDFDIGVGSVAYSYTGTVHDFNSLDELRESLTGQGRRGLAELRSQYEQLKLGAAPDAPTDLQGGPTRTVGRLPVHVRREIPGSEEWLEQAMTLCERPEFARMSRRSCMFCWQSRPCGAVKSKTASTARTVELHLPAGPRRRSTDCRRARERRSSIYSLPGVAPGNLRLAGF